MSRPDSESKRASESDSGPDSGSDSGSDSESDSGSNPALPPDVASHLEQHDRSFLLTLRPDGSPTAHPMTALVDRGALVFNTYRKSAKARNVTRDPRLAALLIDGYELRDLDRVRGFALQGKGSIETTPPSVGRRAGGPQVSRAQAQRVQQRLAEGKRVFIRTHVETARPFQPGRRTGED